MFDDRKDAQKLHGKTAHDDDDMLVHFFRCLDDKDLILSIGERRRHFHDHAFLSQAPASDIEELHKPSSQGLYYCV